ncbi:MAG: hypothetical protein N3G80_00140 [Candidatus Micrarchaeota archaeon]|nr:hypothetical protein [Candidatus Micrarchaeota archaeon]
MIIYFYDLKTTMKDYNRIKRRFYYELKKSKLSSCPWKTKSVIIVQDEDEKAADRFFMRYRKVIEVYKAKTDAVQEII